MSTISVRGRGGRGGRTVGVRLTGMAWVTWRQHRVALVGVTVLLGGLGAVMLVNGLLTRAAFARLGLNHCGDLAGAACQAPLSIFERGYESWPQIMLQFLWLLPWLIGIFVGAPLVARELESGTFRFAWTHGRGRVEWAVTKLVLLGGTLTLLALGFSLLFSWWYAPWRPLLGRMASGEAYEVTGLVFTARTVFGFLLGVLLGAMLRRTVPAMAATAAAWPAVVVPSMIWLRPLIERPLTVPADSSLVTRTGTTIDQWVTDPAGHRVSPQRLDDLDIHAAASAPGDRFDFNAWLARHHYTRWVHYQPDDRFWHFQAVETAGYLVLAALLAAATVAWLRHRAT